MRKLTLALSALAVASLSLIGTADAASKCKKPEKWNASEGKCEKPVAKLPTAKKKA